LFCFPGCDKNGNEGTTDNLLVIDMVIAIPLDTNRVILSNGFDSSSVIMDSYTVNYAEFDSDTLNIEVTYGGGCKEHQFLLIAWNYFLESYPVRANLLLSHNANGDACEALITSKLSFDMTPLKQEYSKLYRGENGSIILVILLSDDKQISLEYKF
jgi:hypothetical protein